MSDLTTDTIALKEEDGMVLIEFPEPVRWVKLDPNTAKAVGIQMAKDAYKAQTGGEADGKVIITQELEAKLITRLTHVIKNLQDKGKLPGFIAQEVMTIVLREVS